MLLLLVVVIIVITQNSSWKHHNPNTNNDHCYPFKKRMSFSNVMELSSTRSESSRVIVLLEFSQTRCDTITPSSEPEDTPENASAIGFLFFLTSAPVTWPRWRGGTRVSAWFLYVSPWADLCSPSPLLPLPRAPPWLPQPCRAKGHPAPPYTWPRKRGQQRWWLSPTEGPTSRGGRGGGRDIVLTKVHTFFHFCFCPST